MSDLNVGDAVPELSVTPDKYLPHRYAGASGDFNPIHIDDEFAKAVGLPRNILHGLYSMGLVARAYAIERFEHVTVLEGQTMVGWRDVPTDLTGLGEAVIASPSRNVIPGEIAFTVDCRSADAAVMDTLDKDLRSAIAEIAARRKVDVKLDLVWRKPPTHFDPKLVDAVEGAAKMLGYSHRRITSGAGHDACNLNTVIPAAMVFVPCKDGISHNELEDATQADCAAGANVLMHTVLALAGVAS